MFGSAKNALLPDVLSKDGAQLNLNLIFLFYFFLMTEQGKTKQI